MSAALPWEFYHEGTNRFWVHYGLVILGFVLAVVTLIAQWVKPAPYGKHESNDGNWGVLIPQRLGHILSDAIPGVLLFALVFGFYGDKREYTNYVFLGLWLLHYVYRGIFHPLLMRYRSNVVPLGITLGGFFPNCLYHFLNADFVGNANFDNNYLYDPRFILGILLYISGLIINRWADFKLRSLRAKRDEDSKVNSSDSAGYSIPYGGLFELVTCPNYLGELIQWLGWSFATWSLAGLVFALFSAATFIPRSHHNHAWYKEKFHLYPRNRMALIPFLY